MTSTSAIDLTHKLTDQSTICQSNRTLFTKHSLEAYKKFLFPKIKQSFNSMQEKNHANNHVNT